jgi:hypothetical protein
LSWQTCLGFDAIVINDITIPSTSMMAHRTSSRGHHSSNQEREDCVWGVPPNFMLPNRLAEEYAILDVMSKGVWRSPSPLGTGMDTGLTA